MISKNKYKEEEQSSKENELFYERMQKPSRMSLIAFYTALNNEKQQERHKKQETDSGINLCVPSCQQPEWIDNTKTEKKANS
ncbi:hypothetical protein [Treponema vincentii]|uniref:hypothetical protein n=1 Tax=Treponema TaxID=157 RepID=UPI001BAF1661|nr:hypothetical protein [Treponema vincentii]